MSFAFWCWSIAAVLWMAGAVLNAIIKQGLMAAMYAAVAVMNASIASLYA